MTGSPADDVRELFNIVPVFVAAVSSISREDAISPLKTLEQRYNDCDKRLSDIEVLQSTKSELLKENTRLTKILARKRFVY